MYLSRGLGETLSDSLANAIARMEGFNVSGSVAQRNNNPGNLRSGPGQSGTDAKGYAIFPDAAAGWAALQHQVDLNISRGLTLREFFQGKPGVYPGYAPAADANDPTNYANAVAGWLGIAPDSLLSGLSPGSFRRVPAPIPHTPGPSTTAERA